MTLSKLSWVLILVALGLALNAPNLIANGETPKPLKNNVPSPASRENQKHQSTNNAQPTNPVTLSVNKEPSPDIQKEVPEQQAQKAYAWLWPPSGPGNAADYGMFFVTLAAVIIALCTLRQIRKQVDANKVSADAALEEAKAITLSERAYVKLSHSPPGILFNNGYCGARITVRNFGRTPARVTAVVMAIIITEIEDPIPPPLTAPEGPIRFRAFLVTNDEFSFTESRQIGEEMTEWLQQGVKRLFIYGYVDYIDQFGQRHRSGYARQYSNVLDDRKLYSSDEAFAGRSNLDLLTEPKYNYDRHRQIGEGFDWVWDDRTGPA